jgi:Mrp family chromosome partitioning ATPase
VEALDTTIGAIDDVESLLQTSVLGVIPYLDLKAELEEEHLEAADLDDESKEKYAFLISLFFPKSRVVEAIRALRTNLLVSAVERDLHTILVTSATQREGKTTVAINLAIALAQLGKRTLLVEADLRKPFLHHAFGLPKEPGLTEVVIGSARLEEAVLGFSDLLMGKAGVEGLIDRPGIDNLFILPSGHQPANPAELLSAPGVASFLNEARQRYDYVVLDAAPILPVADSSVLGSQIDGALLVVRVGQIPRAALRRAKTLLEGARAQILGVCLTGVRAEVSPDYAEMGYYHYRYRYGVSELSPSWSVGLLGGLAAYLGAGLKALLWLALALALGGGIWAWRTGHVQLPSLTRMQAASAPSAQPVPSILGSQLATLTPPTPESAVPDRPAVPAQPTAATAQPTTVEKAEVSGARNHVQYTVVLHTFRTEAQARRIVARYVQQGLAAFVAPAATKQGQWWRVCAGRFATQAETEAFGRKLSAENGLAKFWVTRVAGGES